jgi:hypothetical protein
MCKIHRVGYAKREMFDTRLDGSISLEFLVFWLCLFLYDFDLFYCSNSIFYIALQCFRYSIVYPKLLSAFYIALARIHQGAL